ncbi:hypothetical protein NK6_3728 [Bradyrhizobium diazoefficiens]|uniref:Uncharacterized protein n=1 Tax=Bradyrhizobium diazoefficiens TaxID=1355477 RepID=A0A0E4FT62_9BRAD|nr:hypothetical protein NK6_3728 [Bradyrhizobium diazoefficiens]
MRAGGFVPLGIFATATQTGSGPILGPHPAKWCPGKDSNLHGR